MNDFASALSKGSGHLEYVFHVAGMPWAVSTSKALITFLNAGSVSANTYLRTMFGSETYDGNYFAYDVDLYPLLEVPGQQTITSEDAMSELSGGNWTARIADIPPGARTWAHSHREIHGLEGLHAIANPRIDTSIKNARITEALRKGASATTITFTDDVGGALGTACAAASAAAPVVVWIGGEAISVSGGTTSSISGTATVAERGILNSVEQFHGVDTAADGFHSLRVATAPLNGITNRPCYLWAFILDEDDTTWTGPAKIRHGKVSGNVSFDGSYWNVECLPWWKWLDTDLQVQTVSARLSKYVLSAYDEDIPAAYFDDASSDANLCAWYGHHSPHVILQELDEVSGESLVMRCWVCDPNEAVAYDTIEELEQALCDAMTARSAIDGYGWTYYPSDIGPLTTDCTGDSMYRVAGDIPVLLRWGDWDPRHTAAEWHTAAPWIMEYGTSGIYGPISHRILEAFVYEQIKKYSTAWFDKHSWRDNIAIDPSKYTCNDAWWMYYDNISIVNNYTDKRRRDKPSYILQWGWNTDTTLHNLVNARDYFPVPYTDVSGTPSPVLWVDTAYDIQSATDGTIVQIGSDDTDYPILVADYFDPPVQWTSLANFSSGGTGAGTPTTNYIICAADEGYTTPGGYPALKAKPTSGFDPSAYKFCPGQTLFGYEEDNMFFPHDYWPIIQSFDVTADTVADMFVAILGHGTAGQIAEEIQADHVPDYRTIDWTQLESLIAVSPIISGMEFAFRYNGVVNLWELLQEEWKFHGLTPTYEWIPSLNQYQIRFRYVNAINATVAALSGRAIDNSMVTSDSKTTAEHALNWQVNSIDISMNYAPKDKEFKYVFKVLDASGYAPTGGKINSLSIAPRITQIPDLENSTSKQAELSAYLSGYLENTMDPRPALSCSTTLENFVQIGVGTELFVSSDDVHNQFDGAVGVTEWPAAVSSQTIDPSKSTAKYTASMAARYTYGWAPSMAIYRSTYAGTTVTVTDIDGSGQMFCGDGSTSGWYDHWFFADCTYTETQLVPTLVSTDAIHVTLIERGTKTPTIIKGGEIADMDLRDYTTVAAAGTFCTITGVVGYDAAKQWWVVYDAYDQTLADRQREWIFLADDTLEITDPDGVDIAGRRWE